MSTDKNQPKKPIDPQTEALSKSIPTDPAVEVEDEMQGAFVERRVGAVRKDEEGHPDMADALGNTFELKPAENPDDQMLDAMTESRKVVQKGRNTDTPKD